VDVRLGWSVLVAHAAPSSAVRCTKRADRVPSAERKQHREDNVEATRCVALVRSCTTVPQNATPLLRVQRTNGRPTGSPLHCPPVGFAPSSERTESCRLFPTKQRRDVSPWQGEAGAQRRVRVDPVVVRALRVHVVCHPAPCLAAAIPSWDPMQHGTL
jgi:hypothetical protein